MDLGLQDEDFWRFDNSTRLAVFDALDAKDFLGLAVAVPERVDLAARTTLPVVAVTALTALEHWRLDLPSQATLLAVDRAGEAVYAGPVQASPGRKTEVIEP